MKVRAIKNTYKISHDGKAKKDGEEENQIAKIIIGDEYIVFAISVFHGVPFLQVINEPNDILWVPSFLFEIIDKHIPLDWECNIFSNTEPSLIIGPDFISESIENYEGVVEQWPEKMDIFWKRVKKETK